MDPLRNLGRRARTLVTRAKVTLTTWNNTRPFVQTYGIGKEVLDKVPLCFPFGMSARPAPGGDVILFMNCGTRSHAVAINCDDKGLRITDLQQDEFGFRQRSGKQIVFRSDHIEITTPGTEKIYINAGGDLDITAGGKININVTGDCNLTIGGQTNATITGKFVGSASEWDLTGNLKVTGTITSTGTIDSTGGDVSDQVRSMAADRALYDAHKHGGVQNGSGFTGLTDHPQ